MQAILNFIYRIWDGIRSVFGLIVPAVAQAKDVRLLGPKLWAALHVAIIAFIVGLIYWANRKTHFAENWAQTNSQLLKDLLPSILFLLLYAFTWVCKWVWDLFRPQALSSDFPDIDDAWERAIANMREKQLELTDAALFLIVGKSADGSQSLIPAGGVKNDFKQPVGKEPPIRVFGSRDGIYVTCEGASLMARQAQLALSEEFALPFDMTGGGTQTVGAGDFKTMGGGFDPSKTNAGAEGDSVPAAVRVMAAARAEGRSADQLTEEEKELIAQEERREKLKQKELVRKRGKTSLDRDRKQIDTQLRRIGHLCALIARDRQGFCPLNGILVLVGLQMTDSDEIAEQSAQYLQMELQAIRDATKLRCPAFAVVGDLELASGYGTFVQRLSDDKRKMRVGQRFELVPDVATDQLPNLVEKGVGGVCLNVIPKWVHSLFRIERATGSQAIEDALKVNRELFRFMSDLVMRQKRIGKVVKRLIPQAEDVPLFAGCYFAGTGKDPAPAFLPGVFRRLVEEQNNVSWTNEAESDDRWFRSATFWGYVALALYLVVSIGLAAYWFKTKQAG